MKIETIKGTYESNTFVCAWGDKVLIIDSGAALDAVIKAVGDKKVLGIFLTHEHFDHITHGAAYARHFRAPLYGSTETRDNLRYYRPVIEIPEEGIKCPVDELDETVVFHVISTPAPILLDEIKVIPHFCPGHSAGSIVYQIEDQIFTGDLLFARGVGNVYMTDGKKYLIHSLDQVQQLAFTHAHHGHGASSDRAGQMKNIAVWLKWLRR